ncbi:spore germination protein [Oscillospiraceae bacterium PP1C4]
MFEFHKKNKQKAVDDKVNNLNQKMEDNVLSTSLETNVSFLKKIFQDDDTVIIRHIQNNYDKSLKYCAAYCDGLINSLIINENIIKPLMLSEIKAGNDLMETVINQVVLINDAQKVTSFKSIIEAITYGDTILFLDGSPEALILSTKGFVTRSTAEPDSEKILSGPREGFTESLIINLSLIHRRLRTNELKMKFKSFGRRTNTKACICYLDHIVNKKILKELYRRLDQIDIDGILDTNYFTELIRDCPASPFRVTGYTERPDVVVGKLLEGRIAIFLDGTPVVITVPYLFIENFQSSEDYYLSFFYTSFSRMIRMLGFFLTISVPAFFIAVVAYHQEMLPTPLLINVASERASVPLPAAIEAFIMLLVFDILRETGIRMPSNVGQALSIVGALVIGQAAVEAKLVASPMIIVVATTGITSLLVPKMNAPITFIRMTLLSLASLLGLFGVILGLCGLFVHMLNLSSFGIPQLTPTGNLQYQELKDTIIRAPWWQMITRRKVLSQDKVRMKQNDRDSHD